MFNTIEELESLINFVLCIPATQWKYWYNFFYHFFKWISTLGDLGAFLKLYEFKSVGVRGVCISFCHKEWFVQGIIPYRERILLYHGEIVLNITKFIKQINWIFVTLRNYISSGWSGFTNFGFIQFWFIFVVFRRLVAKARGYT